MVKGWLQAEEMHHEEKNQEGLDADSTLDSGNLEEGRRRTFEP